jgi:hypothetical protein
VHFERNRIQKRKKPPSDDSFGGNLYLCDFKNSLYINGIWTKKKNAYFIKTGVQLWQGFVIWIQKQPFTQIFAIYLQTLQFLPRWICMNKSDFAIKGLIQQPATLHNHPNYGSVRSMISTQRYSWTTTGSLLNSARKKAFSRAKKPVLILTVSTSDSAITLPSLPISLACTEKSLFASVTVYVSPMPLSASLINQWVVALNGASVAIALNVRVVL